MDLDLDTDRDLQQDLEPDLVFRDGVFRDGFCSSYGKLYAVCGDELIGRVDVEELKRAFIKYPQYARYHYTQYHRGNRFVRAQLRLYGIPWDREKYAEVGWNSEKLLSKYLEEGKIDQIPPDIRELERQLHREWLEQADVFMVERHPKLLMQKFFLDESGNPDKAKTTEVIKIRPSSDDKFQEAIRGVPGLCYALPEEEPWYMYVGWDQASVDKAAKEHEEDDTEYWNLRIWHRTQKWLLQHQQFLEEMSARGLVDPSPVGEYVIEIEGNNNLLTIDPEHPIRAMYVRMGIRRTGVRGIFRAHYNYYDAPIFGSGRRGVMMLGKDLRLLSLVYDSGDHDIGWENMIDIRSFVDMSRSDAELTYATCSRFGTFQFPDDGIEWGTITFTDSSFTAFEGVLNFDDSSDSKKVTGLKISSTPADLPRPKWADFDNDLVPHE